MAWVVLSRHVAQETNFARLDLAVVELDSLELDHPVVFEILEAVADNCRIVDIDIHSITSGDEAVTSSGIKPLYSSGHTIGSIRSQSYNFFFVVTSIVTHFLGAQLRFSKKKSIFVVYITVAVTNILIYER